MRKSHPKTFLRIIKNQFSSQILTGKKLRIDTFTVDFTFVKERIAFSVTNADEKEQKSPIQSEPNRKFLFVVPSIAQIGFWVPFIVRMSDEWAKGSVDIKSIKPLLSQFEFATGESPGKLRVPFSSDHSYWNLIYHLRKETIAQSEKGIFFLLHHCMQLNPHSHMVVSRRKKNYINSSTGKIIRLRLKVMTGGRPLFRRGSQSTYEHTCIHIHRAVYLFTTKHNEIDTVVASSNRFSSGLLLSDVLLCECTHFYNLFIAAAAACSTVQLTT